MDVEMAVASLPKGVTRSLCMDDLDATNRTYLVFHRPLSAE